MSITLDEIVRDVERQGPYPDAAQLDGLLNDPDREKRSVGLLLKAGACFRTGDEAGAFRELLESRAVLGVAPLEIMANIVWLGLRLNRAQEAAFECLEFARWAASIQAFDLALEACFGGLLLDQKGAMEILRTPRLSLEIADFYETIARRLQPGGESPSPRSSGPLTADGATSNAQRPTPNNADSISQSPQSREGRCHAPTGLTSKIQNPKSKILVALVVSNLVDDIVAYSKRALYFARYLDPEKYRLHVYSTENFSGRENPLFPYHCARYGTEQTGKNIIAELTERGVPVTIGTRQAPFVAAARELAGRLEQDGIQIVIFQGGLVCPIDWLVARWSRVPLKAAIHIGSSMLVPGLDVTFFDNAVNIEREKDWWPPNVGERAVLRKGADIEELDRQPALSRALWNIPDDAVVIGLLGNHLERRLTEPYMEAIARVLKEQENARFLAFGSDTLPEKMNFFRSRGVAARVCFGGKQRQAGAALKVLDIYANEFPEGGSQSLIEAMACGVPVAALRWDDSHHGSVGAEIVGPEWAIGERNLDRYRELILQWARSPADRREAGRLMRRRAEREFSAPHCVAAVMRDLETRLLRKQGDTRVV